MPFEPVLVTTEDFKNYLSEKHGNDVTFQNLVEAADHFDCSVATVKKRLKQYKKGIGKWDLSITEQLEKAYEAPAVIERLIPSKDKNFVPFGNFSDLKKIIKSKVFYPAFITGLSGNGKTMSVEQACAALNREVIRVNITIETDEDDLIGGFRLVDGNTVWHNGPVVEALERGAVLLLDEIDLASNKILCLQSILEGKGVFLKKIGKYVTPAAGSTLRPIFLRNTPLPSKMDCKHRILLDARSSSSSNRTAPRCSASITGPLCHTVLPSTSLNPPIKSSSSVSTVMLTLMSSLLSCAHACSIPKVLPLPDRPVMNSG